MLLSLLYNIIIKVERTPCTPFLLLITIRINKVSKHYYYIKKSAHNSLQTDNNQVTFLHLKFPQQ